MNKVYIYGDVSGFDIILYSRELTEEEKISGADLEWGECRTLIGVTADTREFINLIRRYGFNEKYQANLIREFEGIRDGRVNSSEIK